MAGPTRWERSEHRGYGTRFAGLVADGTDITGEARLADVLAPRSARILDAGSGMGRIGAALAARGHQAVGVDLDAELLAQSRQTFPDFPVAQARLDSLDADFLAAQGFPTSYDVIVCVGNVMILLAPDSERTVLARLRALLADEGRLLVGFSTVAGPPDSHLYPSDEFVADARAVGLELETRFSTYDLHPYDPATGYAVHILRTA